MTKKEKNDHTRERLLNEAEILFAERGYHAVSVREITTAANSNLAAINYHFGNKHSLYMEVFRSRVVPRAMRVQAFYRKDLEAMNPPSPESVVRAIARAFIEGPLSDEERQLHHQLMAREISQPTEAFELLSEQVMKPFVKELAGRFQGFMPEGLSEEKLILNILSIFFMVFHFNFARETITRVTGHEYDTDFKARLVHHIQEFSLRGFSGRGE